MINRKIKTVFSLIVGLYLGLIVFNNVSDYNSNYQFVSMVAKMSDVFSAPKNDWRKIESDMLHHVLYMGIIIFEFIVSCLLIFGAYQMSKKMDSDAQLFLTAKRPTSIGLALGVFLWFFIFLTVGGEWFLMWQSQKWNAQGNAFFLTICFMLFLIFHTQRDE
ncbi:MAG: DUF2165 domain-containing protein [Saprospiraceae bacterium]|nr:DUF2165 domain-containing protein [Saprospiraceae bacterium]